MCTTPAEALNAFNITAGAFECQQCRYSAFKDKCSELYRSFPEDENAAAYALLSLQVRKSAGMAICWQCGSRDWEDDQWTPALF